MRYKWPPDEHLRCLSLSKTMVKSMHHVARTRIAIVSVRLFAITALLAALACDNVVVVRARQFSSDTVTEEMRTCNVTSECVIADVDCGCSPNRTSGYRAAVHRDHVEETRQACGPVQAAFVICKSCDEWVRPTCISGLCELTLSTEQSCVDDTSCGAPHGRAEEMKKVLGPWPYDY
jgi:hypothetical protein